MFHRRYKLAAANVPSDWVDSGLWRSWDAPLNVVRGESYRQDSLIPMAGPPRLNGYLFPVAATLRREPENPEDADAIRVEIDGKHVGYIAEEIAAQLSPLLAKAKCYEFAVCGIVRGGFLNAPTLGVHLWLSRRLLPGPDIKMHESLRQEADFATLWPPREGEGEQKVSTGGSLHNGRWTELDDTDTLGCIKKAREFLHSETDPLERHFAMNLLEEALYKSRDVISGALDDFERFSEQHHTEMTSIRPALVAFFRGVPVLPTYRQMAVMKTKARDYKSAAEWCRRGLEIYGEHALRDEGVEDLQERLNKLDAKLT